MKGLRLLVILILLIGFCAGCAHEMGTLEHQPNIMAVKK